jgi:hypothetical protein
MIEPLEDVTHSTIDSGESEFDDDESLECRRSYDSYSSCISNYSNPQTMRVSGHLKHQLIIVLIDTCSANNFL